ncbi:carbonic anhydrase [Streptomyces triticirhizae]|uniref:carbonic anhydrase n=1 Tax=Streptomyces triticirhizae TaxID=2483353 RepID=A0A3M2M827_9ACTN|nr:carbonic anhydrase [Streptomyces triticirhizae]RMI43268.1 carbonic anhydrase [Streptomyces triticirhizae]RMI44797.1 carbonic anhydrase [Streptomyces triticirhizae]
MPSRLDQPRPIAVRTDEPLGRRAHFTRHQQALFISCTDARLVATRLTGIAPERLFELRNMGNIVPRYRTDVISSEIAAIQHVLREPSVRDVVLCGHSRCTAVACLLNRHTASVRPAMRRWLAIGRSKVACDTAAGRLAAGPLNEVAWDRASRAHLVTQLTHLSEYPEVRHRRAAGELRLHAWFYTAKGTVEVYRLREEMEAQALV